MRASTTVLGGAVIWLALAYPVPAQMHGGVVRPTSAARLTAPILRAQAISPTQIRLTADTPPGERVLTIWAERTDPAGKTRRLFFNEGSGYESSHWAFTDGAAAACSWLIYGGDDGCLRLLGYGGGGGLAVVATTPSGVPVLVDVSHGSATYAGAALMQLVDGWFDTVDSYGHCSEDDGAITTLSPPFSSCQQDDDLWWRPEDQ